MLLRAARCYRLLRSADLPDSIPRRLASDAAHPAFGGLLVPMEPGFRAQRVVDRATARLFADLTRPQMVPSTVPAGALRGLVLDGVLEIRDGRRYVSGAAAHRLFFPDREPATPSSTLAQLSLRALRHTAELGLADPAVLARLLYAFNTLPVTPAWYGRFPDDDALARELLHGMPAGRWERLTDDETAPAWWCWQRAGAPAAGRTTWKLYLSPRPDLVRAALHAAARQRDPVALKVGKDLFNILRPDKLVLYFASRSAMRRCASALATELAGLQVQGVPFTGQLSDSALISWGVDRTGVGAAAPWVGDESWRFRVTRRLGSALAQAARDPACDVPAWRFAMDRVSLDGVDVQSWSPRASRRTSGPDRHGNH